MIFTAQSLGRYKNLRTALEKIDWQRSKKKSLLKPNLVVAGTPSTAVEAVRAVLDSIQVDIIAEGSGVDTTALYSTLGYKKLALEYGVDLIDLNETDEWVKIKFLDIYGGVRTVRISKYAYYNDIISLALPKTHDHAIVTLTLKNMLGFVHLEDRSLVHGYQAGFGQLMSSCPRLRKLASYLSKYQFLRRFYSSTELTEEKYLQGVKVIHHNIAKVVEFSNPKLGIIDGYIGMEGSGPLTGRTFIWDMAITGIPIECDVYCTYLMGFDPTQIGYLQYLNAPAVQDLKIVGSKIKRRRFEPHPKFKLQLRWK